MHVSMKSKKVQRMYTDSPKRLSIAHFSYFTLTPVNGRVMVETISVGVRTLSMTENPAYSSCYRLQSSEEICFS